MALREICDGADYDGVTYLSTSAATAPVLRVDLPHPAVGGLAPRAGGRHRPTIRFEVSVVVATLSCLLALATSGSAECAWVLWASYGNGRYEVVGASNTDERVCRADALRLEQAELKRAVTKIAGFVCLPDTVDPRAPKAK